MELRKTLSRWGSAFARAVGVVKDTPTRAVPVRVGKNPSLYPRYRHISKAVHVVPEFMRDALGVPYLLDQGKGTTYNVGMNAMKRAADRMGTNNKTRRGIRASMRRRLGEIVEQQKVKA